MKELIVYFSRAGQNYVSGVLQELPVGNTEYVAEILQGLTGADVFKIMPVKPYADDYNTCTAQARVEQKNNVRPVLQAYPASIAPYDAIYLGYPIYWSTMPMSVFTFLEHFTWQGKKIYPFCTHEGSGLGASCQDIRRLCPAAEVRDGLAIRGSQAIDCRHGLETWLGGK
jgi:flavodoxin